jgi:hypothetical protein
MVVYAESHTRRKRSKIKAISLRLIEELFRAKPTINTELILDTIFDILRGEEVLLTRCEDEKRNVALRAVFLFSFVFDLDLDKTILSL